MVYEVEKKEFKLEKKLFLITKFTTALVSTEITRIYVEFPEGYLVDLLLLIHGLQTCF